MATLWQRIKMAVTAFQEGIVTADLLDSESYDDYDSRKLRYQILWAMYESTLFRDVHKWARAYRTQYGLYKSVRNIYNPTYRLVEFWKMMIWGGFLHDEATEEGAIPIRTANEDVRTGIKELWDASDWAVYKDIIVGWGTALGDTAIRIVDDTENKEVRIEPIHPATIKEFEYNERGDLIKYELEETRVEDVNGVETEVTYREVATLEGDLVTYETFVDEKPAPWDDQPQTWSHKYGFIPVVPIQHNDVGMTWGWAEAHPARSKINEIEDLASKLHDYVRKVVDPVWLFNFKKPKNESDMQFEGNTATSTRPFPEREDMPAIYVPNPNAKAQPLVTDMIDIEHTVQALQQLLTELERDFPELQMDIWTVGGYTTGTAMKTARQRVERKVQQRRPSYDKALIKSHKMALCIGGMRGIEGYSSFSLDDYGEDTLDHYIPADRVIFEVDALEELDKKKKFWDALIDVLSQAPGQIPPKAVLQDFGWSEERIEEYLKLAEEYKTQFKSEMDEGVEDGEENGTDSRFGRETGAGRGREPEDDGDGNTGRRPGERGDGRQ
jgi:hypothetical protein